MRLPLTKLLTVAILTSGTLAGCGKAARLFFDLPEPGRRPQREAVAPSQQVAGRAIVVQDTIRPHLDSVLDPDSALSLLPKTASGTVDWVTAMTDGTIIPRPGLPGRPAPPERAGFGFDFRFKGPDPLFDANFPHSTHVRIVACESCHDEIFEYRNTPIGMQDINGGEYCGRCHGKVAFPPTECTRCHVDLPTSGTPEPELIGTIELARGTPNQYPTSQFPHWVHRIQYQCAACHQGLFEMRAGADTVSMQQIRAGESCGVCHDGQTAFNTLECQRCHVQALPKTAPAN